jgi:hypothetical protein
VHGLTFRLCRRTGRAPWHHPASGWTLAAARDSRCLSPAASSVPEHGTPASPSLPADPHHRRSLINSACCAVAAPSPRPSLPRLFDRASPPALRIPRPPCLTFCCAERHRRASLHCLAFSSSTVTAIHAHLSPTDTVLLQFALFTDCKRDRPTTNPSRRPLPEPSPRPLLLHKHLPVMRSHRET